MTNMTQLEDLSDYERQIDCLKTTIKELENQNKKLNIDWMRESAKASEAQEELKRCKLEWEIVADQFGHNSCHAAVARALKVTIGHTGKYPDPDDVSGEQFAHGCVYWHGGLYPNCGFKLEVVKVIKIPEEIRDKGILNEEQAKKGGEALGFKEQ